MKNTYIIFLLFITGCNMYGIKSEPPQRVSISNYAAQCQNINDNYKIQIWCQVTKSGSYTLLQVYYPSYEKFTEWGDAVGEVLAAPFCEDVADKLQREAAVQYLIQGHGDLKDVVAHNTLDCETLEVSGWKMQELSEESGHPAGYY